MNSKAHIDINKFLNIVEVTLLDDIFYDLSKHNPFSDSQHRIEDDKLHGLRLKLSYFQDTLCDALGILTEDGEY